MKVKPTYLFDCFYCYLRGNRDHYVSSIRFNMESLILFYMMIKDGTTNGKMEWYLYHLDMNIP